MVVCLQDTDAPWTERGRSNDLVRRPRALARRTSRERRPRSRKVRAEVVISLLSISKMQLKNILPAGALLAGHVAAEVTANPTSTYYRPGVPVGTPAPGNYTSYLRPRVHYSPPINFMNGETCQVQDQWVVTNFNRPQWHAQRSRRYLAFVLSIQPSDSRRWQPGMCGWGDPGMALTRPQHWGHATSRDLYTWENQKIPFFPPNNYTVSQAVHSNGLCLLTRSRMSSVDLR